MIHQAYSFVSAESEISTETSIEEKKKAKLITVKRKLETHRLIGSLFCDFNERTKIHNASSIELVWLDSFSILYTETTAKASCQITTTQDMSHKSRISWTVSDCFILMCSMQF